MKMSCPFGIVEIVDKSTCKECGAHLGGDCGRLYEAGYRDGFDKAISLLASRDNYGKGRALWLTTVRPLEAGKSLKHADNTPL